MVCVLVAAFVALAEPVMAGVSIRGIHTSAEGDSSRVVITLSEMTRYQYGILPADARAGKPPRVYVDVHGVVLGSQDGSVVAVSDSRVTRIRAGQHKERIARIVVEVQGNLTPKILQLETPPRIIVELTGPGRSDSATVASAPPSSAPASGARPPGAAANGQKQAAAGNVIVSPSAKAVLSNPAGGPSAPKITAQQTADPAETGSKRSSAEAAVSPAALARLKAPAGKGVVTLKGSSAADAAAQLQTSVRPASAATKLSPAAANDPPGLPRAAQQASTGHGSPGKPTAEQAPVVAGRGTQIQTVPAGSAGTTESATKPAVAAGSPTGQPSGSPVPPARTAAQATATVVASAGSAPGVRPPVQAGRGTDLLPMVPLPPGAQPVHSAPEPPKAKRVRVVLDPGHGGKDPGAQGPGGTEKESVLDISLRVASKLKKLGVEVHLTRTDDRYVSLAERKDLANRVEADLFVSVHANASRDADLFGIETYYLKNSNDRATLRLARLENGVDMLIKGNDVSTDADLSYILSDIIQGQKEADSILLANHIQNQLCSNLQKRYDSIHSLGVKQGPFLVLDGTYMPSVLVEAGFITNGHEGRRLGAAAYRESVADGIYRGIKAYLEDDRANDLT